MSDLPPNAPDDLVIEEDDFLDHPDEFTDEEMDSEEEQPLRSLFPKGEEDASLADEWEQLFRIDESLKEIAPRTAVAYTATASYSGSGRDTGIADRLRRYGLIVVEVANWQTRGSSTFHPRGSVDHHTAGSLNGNSPSLGICINGRPGLAGPLCNVFIARNNVCYVVAAGRANHAGSGSWRGIAGNSNMYGVEHENTGVGNESWREDQRDTAARVHAALLDWRKDSNMVCEHKEWTSRKIDKWDQSGSDMRARVLTLWSIHAPGSAPAPQPAKPSKPSGPATLKMGSVGAEVKILQEILIGAGLLPAGDNDGIFGPRTEYALKIWQGKIGFTGKDVDGIYGPATRKKTGEVLAYIVALAKAAKEKATEKGRIKELQKLVGAKVDGIWGSNTEGQCLKHMVGWKKKQATNEKAIVLWLQKQGNRKFKYGMDEDGVAGPQTNHLIVVGLRQSDGLCGPRGFREAVR